MDPTLVASVCSAAGALALWSYFRRSARIRRMVKAFAPTPIEEARQGATVRLSGVVRGARLVAPLRGTGCVHYTVVVVVDRWAKSFERLLFQEARTCDFELSVGEQMVQIHAEDATVELVPSGRAPVSFITAPSHSLRMFLERQGSPHPTPPDATQVYHCVERVLSPGDKVDVIGRACWRPATDPRTADSYREGKLELAIEPAELGLILVRK